MSDDAIKYGGDNLPERQIPWTAQGPQYVTFDERLDTNGNTFYLMTLDTGHARVITPWTRDELEAVLRTGLRILGVAPDGLLLDEPPT